MRKRDVPTPSPEESLNRASLRAALALAVLAAPLAAQTPVEPAPERPRYAIHRATAPVVVDAVLDDAAWGEPTFELAYETRPGDNVPPAVRTLGWVAFDDRYFYFAFRCFDPEPRRIRARYSDRDKAFQDDFVGVVLDTFDDERRAFEFFVNPLGVQMDLIQNDVTQVEDESWDAIWNSAGRLTPEGWEVEAAIPLSSLRFPRPSAASGATGTWGIDAVRIRPRNVRARIGLVPQPRGRNCYLCSEAKLDGLGGLEPGRDVEFDPTVTSHRSEARDPFPAGDYRTTDEETEGGLTARWGITPDLTLLGTLNPDFSQIEADAAQLDVNEQFALFFPEKRPFFLEGADYFDTRIDAVYTRDIADPSWGAKLTGKQAANAIGLVVSRDRTTNVLLPSSLGSDLAQIDEENLSMVGRYRRDLGATSTLGGLYTAREGDDYWNRLAGLDGQVRPNDATTFVVEAMFSSTRYPGDFAAAHGQSNEEIAGHAIDALAEYSVATWRGFVEYEDYADDFRADMGFVPRVGFRHLEMGAHRIWDAGEGERWYTHMELGGNYEQFQKTDGTLIESEFEAFWFANGPMQSAINVFAGGGREEYLGLRLEDWFAGGFAEFRPTGWLYAYGEAVHKHDATDFANVRPGDATSFEAGLRFDVGRHLRLTLDDSYEMLDVEGGRLFDANVLELRATWQFDLRMFVRVVSQYFTVDRDPSIYSFEVPEHEENLFNQLLFSYKINPQTVFFAGYSDSSFGDPSVDLKRADRTLFVKLGYALRL